jgi:putative transposase
MKERITKVVDKSRVVWESLEAWVREKIQGYVQDLLEEEVTALLGREKSERCQEIDAMRGYRNGHGKPRKLSLSCGTVELRRPRVRGLEARFESRILPLFVRRSEEVGALLPELYLHGLAMGDFELALRWLLGEGAPLSESSIARLKAKWQGEYDAWRRRSLADLEVVYLWADGVYVKAGLEKEKAALLVLVAGLSDGRKVVLGVESGYRESTESWSALLRDLRKHGLQPPCLVIGDGHLGLWGALGQVYPESEEQRCWNHRIINILDKLPKKHHADAKRRLRQIAYAETREQAERQKRAFQLWCKERHFEAAADCLDHDWERMVSFYRYPKEHWIHLRTTNPIESPFAAVRLRTDAGKRFKRVDNATALIWKTLMIAEKTFRRLNAPELLKDVYQGTVYLNGLAVPDQSLDEAA